jgi:hypothetical protein
MDRRHVLDLLEQVLSRMPGPVKLVVKEGDQKAATFVVDAIDPAAASGTSTAAGVAQIARTPSKPRECRPAILRVLGIADGRMTKEAVLRAFAALGILHGDRTITAELAEMVRAGILDNRQDAEPRGYAIVDTDADPANCPPATK